MSLPNQIQVQSDGANADIDGVFTLDGDVYKKGSFRVAYINPAWVLYEVVGEGEDQKSWSNETPVSDSDPSGEYEPVVGSIAEGTATITEYTGARTGNLQFSDLLAFKQGFLLKTKKIRR